MDLKTARIFPFTFIWESPGVFSRRSYERARLELSINTESITGERDVRSLRDSHARNHALCASRHSSSELEKKNLTVLQYISCENNLSIRVFLRGWRERKVKPFC